MKYKKKGYHTPAACAARARGSQTMHERRFLHDRTSASVDKETKYRAVAIFGNVNSALVYAIQHAPNKESNNE